MTRLSIGGLLALFLSVTATAEELPYATPKLDRSPAESAVGTLANIMMTIQLRHIKIWSAGKARNWDLLGYEAQKVTDDFIVAASFYRNLPVDNILLVAQPLGRLKEAARTKNAALFDQAFRQLTDGCNSCHASGHVAGVHIQVPKSSPFSNQAFD